MTVGEALTSLSSYPIPKATIEAIGVEVGLNMDELLVDVNVRDLNRAKARVYYYLVGAPNISEGGVSISFSASERAFFLNNARRFARLAGENSLIPGASYGYKGENL